MHKTQYGKKNRNALRSGFCHLFGFAVLFRRLLRSFLFCFASGFHLAQNAADQEEEGKHDQDEQHQTRQRRGKPQAEILQSAHKAGPAVGEGIGELFRERPLHRTVGV